MLFDQWVGIVNDAYNFKFHNDNDAISWRWWWGGGKFTTKSVYDQLTRSDFGYNFQHILKERIPYKIKIFTWFLENNAILKKDNMKNRKWKGNPACVFSFQPETVDHLFFQCIVAKCVWDVGLLSRSK
jgi:hypothetical protein